ncbi:hypothetical protein GCM10022295_75310 [Streptomyces osmaniensis]|uniref:Uncharacterized protein n=1 Tax=Streptomyces osmaniensis TaxID=593134 RepID=A0ABP6YLI5_9ACTN
MTRASSYFQVPLPTDPLAIEAMTEGPVGGACHWLCGCVALVVSSVGPFGMKVAQVCGTIDGLDRSS